MSRLLKPVSRIMVLAPLALVPLMAGCEPVASSAGEASAQFAENLRMFVEDFARMALAAFLL